MAKRRPLSAVKAVSENEDSSDKIDREAFIEAGKVNTSTGKSGLQALKQNTKNRGVAKSIYLSKKASDQLDKILKATGANTSQVICQALDEFYESVKNDIT